MDLPGIEPDEQEDVETAKLSYLARLFCVERLDCLYSS